jgi:hypothetical protein
MGRHPERPAEKAVRLRDRAVLDHEGDAAATAPRVAGACDTRSRDHNIPDSSLLRGRRVLGGATVVRSLHVTTGDDCDRTQEEGTLGSPLLHRGLAGQEDPQPSVVGDHARQQDQGENVRRHSCRRRSLKSGQERPTTTGNPRLRSSST